MKSLTKNELGIIIINILNELKNGRYEFSYDTKKNRYDLVLYNGADYGVYAAIYIPNTNILSDQMERLKNTIEVINKYG